jgi:hypothetical protein
MITSGYQYILLSQSEITEKINAMLKYKRTLRKLFGEKWEERINEYFLTERVYGHRPYERFDDLSFFK